MIRLVNEVPRWSCYLHRSARGLALADAADAPTSKFEDELFERLFAWELEPLNEHDRDRVFGDWAQRIHDTVTQLPAFERLAQECRGRADESAMAVEALINELRPDGKDDELRRSARTACGKASAAVEQLRDAMEGLEHVSFSMPGTGTSNGTAGQLNANVRSLAARLRDDARLRQIALLAGRFKRIAGAKRRSKVKHGADEIVDVAQGSDDLGRLLPLELALLVYPTTRLAALRNFIERQCMSYRLEGTETLGRGPLCVLLDRSGSMQGERDTWSASVALALLSVAQAERRPFALLGFDGSPKHESIVMPGQALPEAGLFIPCDGGTNIDAAIRRGLEIIEKHPGALRKADLVLITDGGSNSDNAPELRDRAAKLGVSILGVAIDVERERLMPWCDQVIGVSDMSRIDDKSAEVLFAGE